MDPKHVVRTPLQTFQRRKSLVNRISLYERMHKYR